MSVLRTCFALILNALLLMWALPVGTAAHAQGFGGPPNITATLVAESRAPAPGSDTAIAISMAPAKGWHGYWINGGDAGVGLTVEWTLPPGVTITPPRYPVPDTLLIAGLMNHVYEAPYALIADVRVAPTVARGTLLPIIGKARWLACTDAICVPEAGVLTLTLVADDGMIDAAARARFDQWRMALPRPVESKGHFQIVGGRIRIALPVPETLRMTDPHLFVETPHLVSAGANQSFVSFRNLLIVETAIGDPASAAALSSGRAILRYADGRGLEFMLERGLVANPPVKTRAPDGPSDISLFLWALGGALIGGILLNLMPCVFPILSLKALSLARAGGDAHAARRDALAYTAGSVMTALALGLALMALRAAGEQVGWAFQLQHPVSVLILLALAVAITANLAGLFELPVLLGGVRAGQNDGARGGFLTGALAAFVATPCSGPFMGAALGATLVLPPPAALAIFGGLGLGLALPFALIACVPALQRRMPRPGAWMATFRRWMALPMALTVLALVWLLWRQAGATGLVTAILAALLTLLPLWLAGRAQRASKAGGIMLAMVPLLIAPLAFVAASAPRPAPSPYHLTDAQPWNPEALAATRRAGRPVFVFFTADWCVTCKVNEAAAIERDATAAAFRRADVAVFYGDWTNGDPAITRALAAHGRNSVPLYLWYRAGAEQPEVLPQILTPAMLADRAAAR
ncbi:MAG: hypothetical protein RLZZ58_631 [Pseudomonadota bacterium]